jgi:hypothetical protein
MNHRIPPIASVVEVCSKPGSPAGMGVGVGIGVAVGEAVTVGVGVGVEKGCWLLHIKSNVFYL